MAKKFIVAESVNVSDIVWVKASHFTSNKEYCSTYVDRNLGIQKDVSTGRDMAGVPTSRVTVRYYIDGKNKAYKTEEELISAIKFHLT